MKVAAITGVRQCVLLERPTPRAKGDVVVVKIHAAPMCTEYHAYKGGGQSDCLGHEAAGEVVEVAQAGRVEPGDRVVVMPQYPCGKCELCITGNYIHCEHVLDVLKETGNCCGTATYAQYVLKQDWLLLPIPQGMSYPHASMACCGLGPTFGAMQRMGVTALDTVLVTGLGPVGLGGIINGVFRGARVIGVDGHPYRAKLAKELGAYAVVDPAAPDALQQVRELTSGRGADKTIDCTAVPAAQKFAMDATRRLGHVAFVGWGGHIERDNMIPQGLTLHGCWHYPLYETPGLMQMIVQVGTQLDKLITHHFPMSQVKQAWELQLTGECAKVVLDPWS